jgi:hypothetical protein
MVEINEKDGVVFLEAPQFDLKIDKSRKIYIKSKESNNYKYVGHDAPEGMPILEKKKLLYDISRRIEAKLRENPTPSQEMQ